MVIFNAAGALSQGDPELGDLVAVHWLDANFQADEQPIESLPERVECVTWGQLMAVTPETVTVAGEIMRFADGDVHHRGTTCLPLGMVTLVRKVEGAWSSPTTPD